MRVNVCSLAIRISKFGIQSDRFIHMLKSTVNQFLDLLRLKLHGAVVERCEHGNGLEQLKDSLTALQILEQLLTNCVNIVMNNTRFIQQVANGEPIIEGTRPLVLDIVENKRASLEVGLH